MNYRAIEERYISKYTQGRNPRIDGFLLGEDWYLVNSDKGLKPILVPVGTQNKKRYAERRYRELYGGTS